MIVVLVLRHDAMLAKSGHERETQLLESEPDRSTEQTARHRGVAKALLAGAVAWAKKQRVTLLEAYPHDKRQRSADDSSWFGAKAMFDRGGFGEVARRRPQRPVVRKTLRGG